MRFEQSPDARPWSNLASVVYLRTYARNLEGGRKESWADTVERVVRGNAARIPVTEEEKNKLGRFMMDRKVLPGGRGLWMSGTGFQERNGGTALTNCFYWAADSWENWVYAQDNLMLGGGVGMSVEHRYVSKLPKVKKVEQIVHKYSKDADFIVPDSREGWNELLRRVLEAFFVTGRSFSYSTVVVRPEGEPISGFGGTASGPRPLISMVGKLFDILGGRAGRHVRPVDAADILCCIGEMVVAGNVRRSACIVLGDPWDREYLRAKDWSRGSIPNYRSKANWSIVADDMEDVHPDYWKTFENGEAYGLLNRKNMQKFGRIGEPRKDPATGTNPCGEISLENGEPCNLVDLQMHNLKSVQEFREAARLMFRYAKRVTCEPYHNPVTQAVVARNRRTGVGLTGCLQSDLFVPGVLDLGYGDIQAEDALYSAELGIPKSVKTTTIKPAGTGSKVADAGGYEGIHPGYSRYMIQRVRIAANDELAPRLKAAGHKMEPVEEFDGTLDHSTLVVDFYQEVPKGYPVADEDWTTWRQLDVLKMVQEKWSDNSVSVSVYYRRDDIPELKKWLAENLKYLKSISFLAHSDHGFKQAPKEAITQEQYEKLSAKIKPVDLSGVVADGDMLDGLECAGGVCPVR